MVDPMDDIARQARSGSVSAIIQVLNEKLADSGIRTRAVLDDREVLQLLCEAPTPEQLEQTVTVERVQSILNSIQPSTIRRVNINSRIVREQQLLWLEEINRDRENQLLWSQEITLTRPNALARLIEDWKFNRKLPPKPTTMASLREEREHRQFWRGIIGGASLSLLVLLLGWVISNRLGMDWGAQIQSLTPQTSDAVPPATPSPSASPTPAQQDPFVQAVRIAEQAAQDGQNADTPAEWLDLATRWQRASDLMAEVQPGDTRFSTAQDRIQVYRQNSEAALAAANRLRNSP